MQTWRNIIFSVAVLVRATGCSENAPSGVKAADVMPKSAKRGVAFSFSQVTDLPILSPYISWDYNWGNTPTNDAALWSLDAIYMLETIP